MRIMVGYGIERWLRPAALAALTLVPSGCVAPAPTPPPPIPAGLARLWFYRTTDFSLSRNLADIELNGARAVALPPFGPGIYRDVAPGNYRITVENFGAEADQSKTVTLAPGQEVFAKIEDSDSGFGGGGGQGVHRDAYVIALMPAAVARAEMAQP